MPTLPTICSFYNDLSWKHNVVDNKVTRHILKHSECSWYWWVLCYHYKLTCLRHKCNVSVNTVNGNNGTFAQLMPGKVFSEAVTSTTTESLQRGNVYKALVNPENNLFPATIDVGLGPHRVPNAFVPFARYNRISFPFVFLNPQFITAAPLLLPTLCFCLLLCARNFRIIFLNMYQ